MCVRAGRPAFARPYVGVHGSTLLMSSSLLLQQCPACLVRLTWIVFVMYTNPMSDRSLLSCVKETQWSTSEIGDALLYNPCSLPIQVITTGRLPAPSKCKSGRFNAWGHISSHRTTLWRWYSGKPHHATSHLRSRPEVNTKVYLDVLKSVVILWCNRVAGGRPWVWQQDSVPAHKSKETQAWLQKECYDFVLFSHGPPPPRLEPAGLLRLVIRREHHQYDLPQHQSQPDRRHPPSIGRGPAGAYGKGKLLVPDPYRGSDWGLRWLHWIDVSSTT